MDKLKLINKLREKANISYEEAKIALENNNWDMLDALLYLEEQGKLPKPSISIFYTNEARPNLEIQEIKGGNEYNYQGPRASQGFFEHVCRFIDSCNNIFFEIRRFDKLALKLPLTVVTILTIFMFWIVIPTAIISLFMDVEFYLSTNKLNINLKEVNKVLKRASDYAKDIKEKFIRVRKHD